MMKIKIPDKLLSTIKKSMFRKIFATFIVVFTILFTIIFLFFGWQQIRYLEGSLINEGKALASALAINSGLGVLSGNSEILKDEATGFLYQPDVAGISIFDRDAAIMTVKKKGKEHVAIRLASILEIKRKMKMGEIPPFVFKDSRRIDIWTPIFVYREYRNEEEMMFGKRPKEKRLVGWAELILDKSNLIKKKMEYLIWAFSVFFLLIIVAYKLIRKTSFKIINPLNKLTQRVLGFTKAKEMQEVPVETEDEVAKLALAFNEMVRALRKREEEKKRLEQQLMQAQKMEAIGTLAGGIAHDFNNILASILGTSEMLIFFLDRGQEINREMVDRIIASCERAREMVDRLLTFSRKQEVTKQPIKLNEQVIMLKKLLSGLISEDIEIQFNLTERDPVIHANATQIYQVLMNLVTNAQDAMPQGGILKISTDIVELSEKEAKGHGTEVNPGKYALISVEDSGIGMDEETMSKIFEPFFTTKGVEKGTGLGLYTSYSIIKDHGGFIDVISSLGEGTTFKIYIPIVEKRAVIKKERESLKDIPPGSGTILVADDDVLVRDFLKDLLNEFGYDVILAANGDDAVRKFKEHINEIDLLLMDIVMPYKHGKSAYDEIKRIKPDVKIIFMSGYPAYVIDEKGISTAGLKYLKKPVHPAILLGKIREALNS